MGIGIGRYRKVETRIWNDERFRSLSDSGKLLFLFLLTHPHLTGLGAMRATIPGLSAELGWPETRCREAFAEMDSESSGRALIGFDERASFVWLPNFLRYNAPENPNVVKSWASVLELLPECPLKTQLIAHARDCVQDRGRGFLAAWETVCQTVSEPFRKPVVNGMPNPEPEPEPEQKQKPDKPVSGVCVSGSGKAPGSRASIFDDITTEVLKDSGKLLCWFQTKAVNDKRLKLLNTEPNALNVFAAAERAIEEGDDPVKLFVFIVGKRQWNLISNEQEDRAKKRLNELKSAHASTRPPMTGSLSNDAHADPQSIAQLQASYLPKLLDNKAAQTAQHPRAVASGATS